MHGCLYCIVEANVERATALFLETNDYLLIGVIATCYFVQSDTQDDQREGDKNKYKYKSRYKYKYRYKSLSVDWID